LDVSLVKPDQKPRLCGRRPRLLELVGGEVETGDVSSGSCGDQSDTAGTAGEIEEPLSCTRRQQLDDALVDRRKGCGILS
jgi:hypothetical protein